MNVARIRMDWDYCRFFLELARTGQLTTAARRLQVDQATVSRRVQRMEKEMGAALFARTSVGMELTDRGRALLEDAESMEAAAARLWGTTSSEAGLLAGVVRVGATEGFGSVVLAPRLGQFALAHPRLTVDLVAVSAVVSISRREADIVVSLERPLRGPFVVTKLCDYRLYLYGSEAYLAGQAPLRSIRDVAQHSLIGYVDDLLFSKQLQFVNQVESRARFTVRSTSVHAQVQAAAAGAGLAVLPAFLADREPKLLRVLEKDIGFERTFWMSMPVEIKQVPRVRATWDFLLEAIASARAVLAS